MQVDYKPSEEALRPLVVPQRLLLGAGPSNCHPRVLKASAQQMLTVVCPEFYAVMDDIRAGLKYFFQTTNELTLAIDGAGHAAMETSLVNVVEPGDRVLILENGIWSQRAREIADRCGAIVKSIVCSLGEFFPHKEIEEGLQTFKPHVLFTCQGESSTGVLQPIEGIGDLCRQHDCLLIVDGVASFGGVPFFMDRWNVDIAYSGSQKVLSAPPGLSPISFGPRARAKMASRKTKVQSFYFDINWLMKYWAVDGATRVYHHTASVSLYYALKESLAMLAEEGLEASWSKHKRNAELLWEGLEKLGLELFVKDKAARLPTVTAIKIPPGMDYKVFNTYMAHKHSLEVAGGLGPAATKVWRIGLLGNNARSENVVAVLKAVDDGLKHMSSSL
eukprot:Em0008g620a